MTLKEAIEILEPIPSINPNSNLNEHLEIVLAAARAFACGCDNGVVFTGTPNEKRCPNCAEDRKIANGE